MRQKQKSGLPWKKKTKLQKLQFERYERERDETIPEKEKRNIQVIRQFAWVMLILAQMAVVHRLKIQAEEWLLRPVQQEIRYDYVEGAADIPQQVTVTVQENGQETEAVCSLQRIEEETSVWQEGFVLPITFHVYDADTYLFDGQAVPRSEEKPQLEGHEEALLEAAGLSGEEYRIRDIVWEGECYTDENGQLCRDAAAVGDKLVRSCRAYYAGTAAFPVLEASSEAVPETREREALPLESELESDTGEGGQRPDDQIGGTAVHSGAEDESADGERMPGALWERITRTLLIAVGIGALLFFLGLFFLAGLRIAKIIHLWYINRRKDKED